MVEFCLLISVCEAWQWSRMRNLRRVGKNAGRVWSRLWSKFITFWDDVGDPLWLSTHLTDCLYHVSFWRYRPLKLRNRSKKVVFGPPIYMGKGYPIFQTCIFKLHLLPTMWPIFVEFCSVSLEGSWRKKKKERRIPVKHKSANRYVGRPNNTFCLLNCVWFSGGPHTLGHRSFWPRTISCLACFHLKVNCFFLLY